MVIFNIIACVVGCDSSILYHPYFFLRRNYCQIVEVATELVAKARDHYVIDFL